MGRHRRAVKNTYATVGVALVGAGVIAAIPIAPPPPDVHTANPAIRLAANSIANVPVNLIQDIVNIPANEFYALNQWADALAGGGSWWLKTPTNVWGWDPGNPPMLQALVAMLVPIPAISGNGGLPDTNGQPVEPGPGLGGTAPPGSLGYNLNLILAAELPMNAKCGFLCTDLIAELQGWFQVPLSDLMGGYTFPTVVNANDPNYPVPWSGQTATLDPFGPITSYLDHLMADPTGIKTVSLQDIITTNANLSNADNVAFNAFVPGSYFFEGLPTLWGVGITIAGVVNRLCPPCAAFTTTPVTSIPSDSAPMLTLNADPVAPDGAGQPDVSKGIEPGATNGRQTTMADAATRDGLSDTGSQTTANEPGQGRHARSSLVEQLEATVSAVRSSDTGSQTTATEAGQGRHTRSSLVEQPKAPVTALRSSDTGSQTTATEAGQGRHTPSTADGPDQVGGNATGGQKGGEAKTGKADSDGTSE
jgi:hypothetical protein